MIIEVNPNKKNKICSPVIGFEAENKVTGFEFDYSDWAADIGDGYLTLSVKRPTDTIPYPVSLTQTGTHKATWTVSSTDVAFAGRGEVQLTYIVDDKVKKSAIYEIYIDRSLEPDGDIPDPYISWFEELLQVSVQVEADADRAEAAANSIKNLEAVAVTLPSGESATAEYDPETGIMSFGIPKGDKGDTGDTGATGNGISSTVLNADYTLTINFTDGTSYTTPSIRGEQGPQGATGPAGKGIANTVLNPDYTLTITFTDGTSYTTPSIRGQQGAQGPAGNGINNVTMDASGYLTITFTDGSTWTSPTSLIGPVQDVKVNGESVVDENGVANITVPIITKTVSGNPIVLDDADGAVQALDVELLPVQEGSGTPSPQNIRPITGRTQTDITDKGKNLFDNSIALSTISAYSLSGNPMTVQGRFLHLPPGTYKWSYAQSSTSFVYGNVLNADGSWVSTFMITAPNPQNPTVTLTAGQYMSIFVASGTIDAIEGAKIQLEYGSTATAYEPYTSTTTTVTLPHTVYGADVDVKGGEGKEKYGYVDLGSLNWTKNTTYEGLFNGEALNPTATLVSSVRHVCSIYKAVDSTTVITEDSSIAISANGYNIYAHDSRYTTAAEFKQAMNGVYLCYELATPTDLQTTPTDVELYKGDNVVSGDGNMTLTYVRNLQKVIDKIESAL